MACFSAKSVFLHLNGDANRLCTLIQPLRQKWHVQKKEHVVCYLDEPIFEMNVQLKDVNLAHG